MWPLIAMLALGIGRYAIFQLGGFGGAVISVEVAYSHSRWVRDVLSCLNLQATLRCRLVGNSMPQYCRPSQTG